MRNKKGFSLIELVIAVTIVGFLTTTGWVTVRKNIDRARDAQRRSDLEKLKNHFEDYYNDKGCYPTAPEVCCDAEEVEDCVCHICGKVYSGTVGFKLPCDPLHPDWEDYLYRPEEGNCPQNYQLYALLARPKLGGKGERRFVCDEDNCGADPYCCYNYGATSSNISRQYCYVDECSGESFCGLEPTSTPAPTNTPAPTETPTPTEPTYDTFCEDPANNGEVCWTGSWTSCKDCAYSDTCDESSSGTKYRDYKLCSSGTCSNTQQESTSCTCSRDTDGTTCWTGNYTGCTECEGYQDACDETNGGTKYRDYKKCSNGSCTDGPYTSNTYCNCETRDTDGVCCSGCDYLYNTCDCNDSGPGPSNKCQGTNASCALSLSPWAVSCSVTDDFGSSSCDYSEPSSYCGDCCDGGAYSCECSDGHTNECAIPSAVGQDNCQEVCTASGHGDAVRQAICCYEYTSGSAPTCCNDNPSDPY